MGEQVAIESYLRGMIAEFDKTKCKQKGCDQGFHNYLHYSGGLSNVKGIREVKVFDQGKGIINNLGALRAKPLSERGVLNNSTMQVINWDGSVSAVAHQFDRDDELNKYIKQKKADYVRQWSNRDIENKDDGNSNSVEESQPKVKKQSRTVKKSTTPVTGRQLDCTRQADHAGRSCIRRETRELCEPRAEFDVVMKRPRTRC